MRAAALPMMSTVTRNSKNRKREDDNYIKTVHQEKGSKRNTDMNVQLRSAKIKPYEEDSPISEAWAEQHTAKHCSTDGCENQAQN